MQLTTVDNSVIKSKKARSINAVGFAFFIVPQVPLLPLGLIENT